MANEKETDNISSNFITEIIDNDLSSGKHTEIITRFPPEPNGYLHIGHAKAICLNFGIAKTYGGRCHLRFDDTNPEKEDVIFTESIKKDINWLGFDWGEHLYYASSYFDQLYEFAERLIKKGKAYVCSMSPEEIRKTRGTAKSKGKESPYRQRSVEENLDLFRRMKTGEFKEGEHLLRAKIDMSHPNVLMRDPVIYRIRYMKHHKTGNKWCIYPMYDFAHGLSDAIEKITHSLCTLEFEAHRPLYNWINDTVETEARPQQIEFARLNLSYTVMSKRKLMELVKRNLVSGWDDPRMPTISGMKRRGYPPAAIRDFASRVGIAKRNSMVDLALLEHCVRDDLNKHAQRFMGVIDPVKLIVENYPEDKTETFNPMNNPEDESAGTRDVEFTRELYVERNDFREEAPRKWRRLTPGKEVRLRNAYYVTCTGFKKDNEGNLTEIHCTYDPESRGGWTDDGRKVKGTIHWVSAKNALNAEVRLYDKLFTRENPLDCEKNESFMDFLDSDSLKIIKNAKVEPKTSEMKEGEAFQFERVGYFCVDPESTKDRPVFNRTVTLRDKWKRMQKKKSR